MIKWLGKKLCDFCKKPVSEQKDFYDAKTKYGPWAIMCQKCFEEHSLGKLGIGFGQKYDGKTFEKLGM